MLTCKEVSRLVASDELPEAHLRKRWAVRLHLLMCQHCRRYIRQLGSIGKAIRRKTLDSPSEPESRDRLKRSILDKIPPKDQD